MAESTAVERVERNWLILEYPKNPTIRLDARMLDRVLAVEDELVLVVCDTAVSVTVASGSVVARQLAEQLAPYTRAAPITQPETYEDAKRRLDLAARGLRDNGTLALFLGRDDIDAATDGLYVGDRFVCTLADVERYALNGQELPLRNGRLRAALARLVVAAIHRTDDAAALAQRVAEYETQISNERPS